MATRETEPATPLERLIQSLRSILGNEYFGNETSVNPQLATLNLIKIRALGDYTPQQQDALESLSRNAGLDVEFSTLFKKPYSDVQAPGIEDASFPSLGMRYNEALDVILQADSPRASEFNFYDDKSADILSQQKAPAQGGDPTSIETVGPSGTGGGGTTGGGGGGGGFPGSSDLPAAGTARQVPGGYEVWRVDGRDIYLAYKVPGTDVPLVWKIENPDRLNAIFGGAPPPADQEISSAEFKSRSPWLGGLSAELQNTSEEPFVQFMSDFNEAAKLRPWLRDPSMLAVMAGSYLEGRPPTQDELSQTDWWNDHTADERAWMERSVTLGRDEMERLRDDASRAVAESLRQAGVSNASDDLVRFLAEQRLTGKWSQTYTAEQIRKLSDPFAAGELDTELTKILSGSELDTTRKGEEEVRQLMTRWLGPEMGRFSEKNVKEWAGKVRNDPDAQTELVEMLRSQRLALLPKYDNPNLTYEDIIQPVRNLAANVWGQPVADESLLVDLANTGDYTVMAQRLRQQGLNTGVRKVVQDSLSGLGGTSLGEQVIRSAV